MILCFLTLGALTLFSFDFAVIFTLCESNSKENKVKAPNVKKHNIIFEIDYMKLVKILRYALRKVYGKYNGNNEDMEISWVLEDEEDYLTT